MLDSVCVCVCLFWKERNLWVGSGGDWALTQEGLGEKERAHHMQLVLHSSPFLVLVSFFLFLFLGAWKFKEYKKSSTRIRTKKWVLKGFNGWLNDRLYLRKSHIFQGNWPQREGWLSLAVKQKIERHISWLISRPCRLSLPPVLAPLFRPLYSNGYFFLIIIFILNLTILN